MLVQPADNGRPLSYSDVLKRPTPVYKILEALPNELIQIVVLHVTTIKDLRSLARVNRLFQEFAEPRIYQHILIRQGLQARKLAIAVRSRPIRATWIRTLQNACLTPSFNGLIELPSIMPLMTKLEDLLVETPDCNAFEPEERLPWIAQQVEYSKIFLKSVQPHAGLLPKLRSCTLHFVDKTRSLYSLGHYSIIFLHPALTELTISCANIDPPNRLHPILLQNDLANTTPLATLNLIECDFHPQGLYHLLSLPRRLTSLNITEAIHYAFYVRDRRYSGLNTPTILHPIASLQPSLQHLRIARLRTDKDRLFSLTRLDLAPFNNLHSVEFAHVQNSRFMSPLVPDWCELVHRAGPQFNTGSPASTTTLTYSDIPPHWWDRGFQFFTCAFTNKISHGIDNVRMLKLVLVDDELLIENRAENGLIAEREKVRAHEFRRVRIEKVRKQIRDLGLLGRKKNVEVRLVVEWIRPNGRTIPPYLMGEDMPEVRLEYDSALDLGRDDSREEKDVV
jgi:hypothetical protein